MSLTLILAVTAAVAASMGYLAARRQGESDVEPDDDADAKKNGPPDPEGRARPAKPEASAFEGLPVSLGDVVTAEAEERWLAGALIAREQRRVIGVLFVAPEGAETKAVAAFPEPRRDLYWMSPVEIVSPDEPPSTIEVRGIALRRKSRIPVTLERLGQGAPDLGDEALWAIYEAGGRDVAIALVSRGKALAWMGVRLDSHEYDRLGAGGD